MIAELVGDLMKRDSKAIAAPFLREYREAPLDSCSVGISKHDNR